MWSLRNVIHFNSHKLERAGSVFALTKRSDSKFRSSTTSENSYHLIVEMDREIYVLYLLIRYVRVKSSWELLYACQPANKYIFLPSPNQIPTIFLYSLLPSDLSLVCQSVMVSLWPRVPRPPFRFGRRLHHWFPSQICHVLLVVFLLR